MNEQSRNRSALFIDWGKIDHFSPVEFSGHMDKLSAAIINTLADYRKALGFPIYISPATWGSHSSKSYHSPLVNRNTYSWAIDIFPACSLIYAYHVAMRSIDFGGIGIYPFWSWEKKRLMGGLHLDIRRYTQFKTVWWYSGAAGLGEYRYLSDQDDVLDMIEVVSAIGTQS